MTLAPMLEQEDPAVLTSPATSGSEALLEAGTPQQVPGLANENRLPNAEVAFRHLQATLTDDELSSTVAGACHAPSELEQLRIEFGKLKRQHAAMTARLSVLENEVAEAGVVQREIDTTPIPALSSGSIHRYQRPAEPLSGDLCLVQRIDESRISIVLADATGHGVSAAMLTAFCRPIFAERVVDGVYQRPADVLRRVNAAISNLELSGCQFLSAVVADYNEVTRELTWSRAGAPYPVLSHAADEPSILDGGGPLLGMTEDASFTEHSRTMQVGDRLVIFTDGLESMLQRATGICPSKGWFASLGKQNLCDVVDGLDAHLKDMHQYSWEPDDVSLVVLDCHDLPIETT
ncbi:MAG: PP2C family protein-serine/threonine phosphatase [Phycisphaerae bacterium]